MSRTSQTLAALILPSLVLLSNFWDAPTVILTSGAIPVSGGEAGGDLARQLCFLLLFVAACSAVAMLREVRLFLSIPVIFVLLLGWCWLSLVWAIDPVTSARRIAFTTIIIVTVSYSVLLLPTQRTLELLFTTLCLVLLLDWAAVLVIPNAIHQPGEADTALVGNWRGLHKEKNEAGAICALAFLVLVHEAVRLRSRLAGPILSVVALVFLYQTRSKTSGGFVLVALLAGGLSYYVFNNPALRRTALIALLLAALLVVPFAEDSASGLLGVFDDPASFTGRVQIWPVLLSFAADHPLFGAGYGSFWGIGNNSPVFKYGSGWVTTIFEAHNGYLDLLVQLGAIGLGLAFVNLITYPFYILFFKPLPPDVPRSLICSVLTFVCLHNLLETSLLDRSNPMWVIMLILYVVLFGRGRHEA